MSGNYSAEVDRVYVTLEADVAEYYANIKKAVKDTEGAFNKVKPPSIAPDAQERNATMSWVQNITGKFSGLSGATKSVRGNVQNAINSIMMFRQGRAPISAVAGSVGGVAKSFAAIASAANPASLAAVAALVAIGVAAKNVTDKLKESTSELKSFFSGDIIAGSRYKLAPKLGVDTASAFEKYKTEFSVLLGNEEKASKRISEYANFGAKTPYNLPEIVRAGKVLQTMGGDALATGDALRMVGDVAAGAGRPFTELAMWVGRAYTAIQSGKPFGEAAARLQEMGVLSGTTRVQLEKLQKQGASSEEQWKAFTDAMGKYDGMMEKLSGTLGGMQSNLEDFQEQVVLVGGTPVFDEQKRHLEKLIGSNGVFNKYEKEIKGTAKAIGEMKAAGLEFKNLWAEAFVSNLPYESIQKIMEGAAALVQRFNDAKKEAGGLKLPKKLADGISFIAEKAAKFMEIIKKGGDVFSVLVGAVKSLAPLGETFKTMVGAILTIGAKSSGLGLIWESIVKYFKDAGGLLNLVSNAMTTLTQMVIMAKGVLVGFIAGFKPAFEMVSELALAVEAAFNHDFKSMQEHFGAAKDAIKDGIFDTAAAHDAAGKSMIDDWNRVNASAEDAVDTVREYPEAINEAANAHAKRMGEMEEITTGYLDQLYDARQKTNEQLADLEKSHAEAQQKINDNAAKARKAADERYQQGLSALQKQYDKQREKILGNSIKQRTQMEKAHRRSVERAEEDHVNRLRDIRRSYDMSLNEAIKTRDARAIADAQAAYQQQVQAENEGYSRSKSRQEEDYQNQRQQFEQQLQEQLAALDEATAAQRTALKAQNEAAWKQIQESQVAQLQAENEGYQKRRDALNEALQKRLADIGEKFAKERKLTKDEARQVLTILNDTFGLGGDIDKIMDDFVKRTSAMASMEIDIKRQFSGTGYMGKGEQAASQRYSGLAEYYNKLKGGQIKLATGGLLLARRPTALMVGEGGEPEVVSVSPISALKNMGGRGDNKITIDFTGSAPPGITEEDRDRIADVITSALLETGIGDKVKK